MINLLTPSLNQKNATTPEAAPTNGVGAAEVEVRSPDAKDPKDADEKKDETSIKPEPVEKISGNRKFNFVDAISFR